VSYSSIVREDMLIQKCASASLPLVFLASSLGFSQSVSANVSGGSVSSIVQPALADVQRTVTSLNTARWKAPNEVKAAADRNVSSIQRDIVDTLPNLLTQADGATGSVPPAFAVYRNIDALYDVLLRVNQTAFLAAPDSEASAVASALDQLEAARRQLGDTIVASAQDREAQIVKLQAAVKAAEAAPPPPPAKTAVVDDGPAATPAVKKKKKPAAKPAPKPPAANSGSGSTPPPSNPPSN
jgi:hypothetical protein